ncbi:MAG: hypothetical protein KY457_05160 [Actinobacteria bacterium]|nr:hypothetical protein [Actinomycetota bacterium]
MRTRDGSVRAWGLTAAIAAAVLGVGVYLVRSDWAAPHQRQDLPAWLIAALLVAAIAVAESHRLNLYAERETHSFTLSELPTTVGLFLLSPALLLAVRGTGVAVALWRVHHKAPVKLLFNVVNGALEAGLAAIVFHFLVGLADGQRATEYLIAIVSVVGATALGIAAVWLVIRLVEGSRSWAEFRDAAALGLPIAMANAAVGLSFVVVLQLDPALLWIPVVPFGVLLLAYRAYEAQWKQKDTLGFLYDTAVDAHAHPRLDGSLLELVRGCRAHLDAEVAEIVVLSRPDAGAALVVCVGGEDIEEVRTTAIADLPLDTRRRLDADAPAEHLSAETVSVRAGTSEGGITLLAVRHPARNMATFGPSDLDTVRALTRLAVMAADRSELEEMKSAFLSAVSHELRTPLTVVMGAAATLKARSDVMSLDQRDQFVDRLDKQAHKLDRLLSDLLDLDRLSRGMLTPRRRRIDLLGLVSRVVDTLDPEGHTLRITGSPFIADVDPALIERVIENLVRNAVKYSPAGTTITVGVTPTTTGVAISVDDEGPGIPESARQQVLDPFFRLHHDHPQPGTGVGLTLVKRFAQLHDGDVTIGEGRSGGARVVVDLPQREQQRPPLAVVPTAV